MRGRGELNGDVDVPERLGNNKRPASHAGGASVDNHGAPYSQDGASMAPAYLLSPSPDQPAFGPRGTPEAVRAQVGPALHRASSEGEARVYV